MASSLCVIWHRAARACLLLAATLIAGACRSATSNDMGGAGRRLLLVGIDAADWLTIEPLVAGGRLPTFAHLLSGGRSATLVATPPLVSPLLWTTIATGRQPEEHGVLDFMTDLPNGGQAPVSVSSRRVAALWNVFSEHGRSVAVIGWWATWPAEDVRGVMVSDRVAPQLLRPQGLSPGSIAPATEARRLETHVVRPEAVTRGELAGYVPLSSEEYAAARVSLASGTRAYADPIAHLAAVIAATRTYGAMTEDVLRSSAPHLTAVYVEAIDTVSHRFIGDPARGRAAIEAAYRDVDALLARLAAAAPPDTWVIVCSDHGFQPHDAGVREDPADLAAPATAWHRPYGIAAAAEARSLLRGAPPGTRGKRVSLTALDIAPTILHAAGLPLSSELPGRVVAELLPDEARARAPTRVPAFPRPTLPAPAPQETASKESIERLKALGYVGTAPTSLARLNLGETLYRRGRLEAAARELRAVVEAQPTNLSAHLWLARALLELGRPREALRTYEAAFRLPGGASAAAVAAAEAAVEAKATEQAWALLSRPADADSAARVARGILELSRGRRSAAKAELLAALKADPASFEALSRLLDVAISEGRPDTVVPLAEAAVARAPSSAQLLAVLGEALLAARRPDRAEEELERALALAPDGDAVRLDLARARLQQQKPQPALAALEEARGSRERSVLRGAALSQLGRWEEARQAYRDALELGDPSASLLNGLAWAELKSGRRHEAAVLLERSLALDAAQPPIRRLLAELRGGRAAP